VRYPIKQPDRLIVGKAPREPRTLSGGRICVAVGDRLDVGDTREQRTERQCPAAAIGELTACQAKRRRRRDRAQRAPGAQQPRRRARRRRRRCVDGPRPVDRTRRVRTPRPGPRSDDAGRAAGESSWSSPRRWDPESRTPLPCARIGPGRPAQRSRRNAWSAPGCRSLRRRTVPRRGQACPPR
jgi:hypothetical protein